jgi:ferredoxin-nitrite reductase
VTGCHNSCAQHYIGDIGLEGTKVEVGEEMVEGYHLCVGGGWGLEQGIGRRLLESLPFDEIPPIVERLLLQYLESREGPEESFAAFVRRHSIEDLRSIVRYEPAGR